MIQIYLWGGKKKRTGLVSGRTVTSIFRKKLKSQFWSFWIHWVFSPGKKRQHLGVMVSWVSPIGFRRSAAFGPDFSEAAVWPAKCRWKISGKRRWFTSTAGFYPRNATPKPTNYVWKMIWPQIWIPYGDFWGLLVQPSKRRGFSKEAPEISIAGRNMGTTENRIRTTWIQVSHLNYWFKLPELAQGYSRENFYRKTTHMSCENNNLALL